MRCLGIAVALIALSSLGARAADITVFSPGIVNGPLNKLAASWTAQTGSKVTITGGKWTTYRKVRAPAPHAERPRLPCAMMCARLTRAWLSLRWRRTLWMPPWLTLDCSKMVGRASRRGCPSLERAAGTPAWRSGWRSKLSPRRSPWTPALRRTSPTRMVTALLQSWMWRSKRARNSLLPAGPSWRLRLFIAHGRSFA